MQLTKVVQIASKGLVRNKLRSLLTMLGIIIGVAAVIIMISISAGTEQAIEDQITGLGSNLIFVQANFSPGGFGRGGGGDSSGGLVYDDAFAIADEVNGVTAVAVEQGSSDTVKADGVTLEGVSILGTTPDFPSVRDMTIETGRYFNETDLDRSQKVAVLGASLAEELFGETPPIGQSVTVGNTRFTVIGVFEERGMVGNTDFDSRIYLPITVVFQKFTPSMMARVMGDRVRLIYVEVDDQVPIEDIILQTELLLAKRHDVTLEEPDFVITTQQDIIQTQEATTEAFLNLLAWVAAVSLIVGGIGIMNIM
ncbi:MAG: ABC transporter permease, partial [Anaerolineales bacterium]|nr:ABC transporter permease [Anaerolineales bacterium]